MNAFGRRHKQRFRPAVYCRLQVFSLEARLSPGETLLGQALAALWWEPAAEALSDSGLVQAMPPPAPLGWRTPGAPGDQEANPGGWTALTGYSREEPLVSPAPSSLPVSTVSASDPFSLPALFVGAADEPSPERPAGAGGLAHAGAASFVASPQTDHSTGGSLASGASLQPATTPPAAPASAPVPSGTAPPPSLPSLNQAQVQKNYGRLPLAFEANVGQADGSVQFLAHGPGYGLFLTSTEAVMVLSQGSGVKNEGSGVRGQGSGIGEAAAIPIRSVSEAPASAIPPAVVRMEVLAGNPAARAVGQDPLPGKVNYFLGNDPSRWHTNVATYRQVDYPAVYPGIDLVYYGNQQQLEYDFVVSPGADPGHIRLGFTGADQVAVDGNGDLVLRAGSQELRQHKPVVYQDINGFRREVPGAFRLAPAQSPLGTSQVAFALGAYDASRPLVIDPGLSYSTYLGGSNLQEGRGIAVDAAGSAYVTGATWSSDFPTANAFQPTAHGANAFVTKFAPDGSALLFSTYLGGSYFDGGHAIALDRDGNVYVAGETRSSDFPLVNPLQPAFGGGVDDAFVAKLAADGSALDYSTYLGGSGVDEANGIAVDGEGNAYIAGNTSSTDFPTVNAVQPTYGGGDFSAFIAKVAPDGSALLYSTYLGGNHWDWGTSIAVDGAGDAYVTGVTGSTNFPTVNALQPTFGGIADAFVTKFAPDGSALLFSTYLGGYGLDQGNGVAVDAAGSAYVTGSTDATNFPTVNAVQPASGGGTDAFVTKFAPDGSALLYSTYLGGSSLDTANGIAVDADGNAYLIGSTWSTNFPTLDAFQPNFGGGYYADAFVAKLSAGGASLVYSSYLGGSGSDGGNAVAVDTNGNAYVTGNTASADFPTANALQPAYAGVGDAFVAKIGT